MPFLKEQLDRAPDISFQDVLAKTAEQRKLVESHMDATNAGFHPEEVSLYNGLGEEDSVAVYKRLHNMSLKTLMEKTGVIKEYLGQSSNPQTNLGASAGAAYTIPDKVYDIIYTAACSRDIVPDCSPIYDTPGSTLKIDIEKQGQYFPYIVGAGGEFPQQTMEITQATITPKLFQLRPTITQQLIEDNLFDLMEVHLRRGGEMMGDFGTRLFIDRLVNDTSGDGTQLYDTSALANSKCVLADGARAWFKVSLFGFVPDVWITNPFALTNILSDSGVSGYANEFHNRAVTDPITNWGTFMGMKVIVPYGLGNTANATTPGWAFGSNVKTASSSFYNFIINKANATATVRKRWLKMDKYADPVQDLVGAVITGRQSSVYVYRQASYYVYDA